jgi:hypothetical protein
MLGNCNFLTYIPSVEKKLVCLTTEITDSFEQNSTQAGIGVYVYGRKFVHDIVIEK